MTAEMPIGVLAVTAQASFDVAVRCRQFAETVDSARRAGAALREADGMAVKDPVNLDRALASFDDVYSPRIVTRVNDYDVRIAHVAGEHVWHVHDETDEFFLVLDGRFDVAWRDAEGVERTVVLERGDTFVVPRGTEHKPSSPGRFNLDVRAGGDLDDRRPPRGACPGTRRQHYRSPALSPAAG